MASYVLLDREGSSIKDLKGIPDDSFKIEDGIRLSVRMFINRKSVSTAMPFRMKHNTAEGTFVLENEISILEIIGSKVADIRELQGLMLSKIGFPEYSDSSETIHAQLPNKDIKEYNLRNLLLKSPWGIWRLITFPILSTVCFLWIFVNMSKEYPPEIEDSKVLRFVHWVWHVPFE